jgi:hypothetical protein
MEVHETWVLTKREENQLLAYGKKDRNLADGMNSDSRVFVSC